MTVVKSLPAAVVYAVAITSMNDVMRDYDTSSLVYDLDVLALCQHSRVCDHIKAISHRRWP